MDAATISAVLTEAAKATAWTQTNLGKVTEVTHKGETWTVLLPSMGTDENGEPTPTKARITGRNGHGGTTFTDTEATWRQTIGIVEAAMSATRLL